MVATSIILNCLARRQRSVHSSHKHSRMVPWQVLPAAKHEAFSMAEVLIAVVIAGLALSGTIAIFNSQFGSSSDARTRNQLEAIIARDLNWIRTYAKIWRMASGPYNVSTTQTGSSAFTSAPLITYTPTSTDCADLASAFNTNAAGAAGTSLVPTKPYTIPTTLGTSQTLATVSGVSVARTINVSTGVTNNNTLAISYALSGGNAANLGLDRQTAVFLEASSWCPP